MATPAANSNHTLQQLLANRIKQLSEDIKDLQASVCEVMEGYISKVKHSLKTLEYAARIEGYHSFDEFENEAFKTLPAEHQALLSQMKSALEGLDGSLAFSHKTFRAIISITVHAVDDEHAVTAADLKVGQAFIYALTAITGGSFKASKGYTEDANKLFDFGKEALEAALDESRFPAGSIQGLKYTQHASGLVLEILREVNDSVLNADDHTDIGVLRMTLHKLATARFLANVLLLHAGAFDGFRCKSHDLIQAKVDHHVLVKIGQETKAKAHDALRIKLLALADEFRGVADNVSRISPEAVFEKLRGLDEMVNAWTHEDPSLSQIEAIIPGV